MPTGAAAVERMRCIRRGARAQEERLPAVLGLRGRGWHLPLVPLQSVCWSGVAGRARALLARPRAASSVWESETGRGPLCQCLGAGCPRLGPVPPGSAAPELPGVSAALKGKSGGGAR